MTATLKELVLDAMMATTIPQGISGVWTIRKMAIHRRLSLGIPPDHDRAQHSEAGRVDAASYPQSR